MHTLVNAKKILIHFLLIIPISIVFALSACSSGNGNNLEAPSSDLSGTWSVKEIISGNCDGENYPQEETYTATVTQTGNNLSIALNSSISAKGTISGNNVTWKGTYSEGGGNISINFSGTVSADGNSITGKGTWTWENGSYSCSGTADISATRMSQEDANNADNTDNADNSTCAAPGMDVSGTWLIAKTSGPNTCGDPTGEIDTFTLVMTQSGSSVTESNGILSGQVCGNTITLSGSESDSGGTTAITFTGTGSSTELSGTISWEWTEPGYTCSGTDTFTATRATGDDNDTFASATSITLPYTSSGASISTSADVDYYVFMTTGTGTIAVDLTDLDADFNLYLYDDSQAEIDWSMNSGTADESIYYYSEGAGTFYVMVEGSAGSVSSYTLSVTFTEDVDDGNDTFASATSITLPYTSSGASISTSADLDYYVFTTTGNCTIMLTDLYADLDLCLYDDSQTGIGWSTNGGTFNESINYYSADEEIFYIKVEGWFGAVSSYTLSVTSE